MATVVTWGKFDFANPPAWTTFLASPGTTSLQLYQSGMVQTFYGSFTYTGTTSNPQVHGTVNEIHLTVDGVGGYQISELSLDAAQLQKLVLTPNGGVQFLAYVLAGNDYIPGVGQGRAMGFAGNDTLGAVEFNGGSFDGGDGIDTFQAGVGVIADLSTGRVVDASNPQGGYLQLRSVENLQGDQYDDTLSGNAGDNLLNGGLDNVGIDTVSYASAGVAVQVDLGAGTGRGAGNDTLLGFENVIGGAGNDSLVGDAGANRLDGGAGNDTLRGGLGDDTYVLRQAGDVIIELAGGGRDTLVVFGSTTLSGELENLQLDGTLAIDGTGSGVDNRLVGNAAGNHLYGVAGNDTLDGGAGNDTLDGGAGTDQLAGGLGNDTLDGGAGSDRLAGGDGNDFYLVGDATDVVTADTSGLDTVLASVSYTLSSAAVETLALTGSALNATGNALANRLIGTAAANVLDGRLGADTMQGGAGNDSYFVDGVGDQVVEAAGAGVDRVFSSLRASVLAANVETLVLTGSSAVSGTGNTLANLIVGTSLANQLDGGLGADTLQGGAGNDNYVVDQAGDVIVEAADGGTDAVRSSVSWTLGAGLEILQLTGTAALNGTGNAAGNRLNGNAAANRLDGGAGADTLVGGEGNDTYVVDAVGDRIVESSNAGTDVVYSAVSWTLGTDLEQLRLSGSAAINATGNAQDNLLVGNAGANRLDGGGGVADADTMAGGAGNDTYIVDSVDDVVIEAAGAGYDTVVTSVRLTLAANVEKGALQTAVSGGLTGNALANALVGSSYADTLDGGAGADTMAGGEGNDLYVLDNAGDVVIESGSSSGDEVGSYVSVTALANGVERLVLLGSSGIDGTGNAADNYIEGTYGSNRLDGGAGADTLLGGYGNDIYVVDNVGDVVDERDPDGIDVVWTSVSLNVDWARVEEIHLSGSADLDITSQAFGVTLVGNAGSNRLDGIGGGSLVSYANATGAVNVDLQAGTATGFGNDQLSHFNGVIGSAFDDTLRGNADTNRLTGGAGSDRFELWNGSVDQVLDFQSGVDQLVIDQSGLPVGNGDLVIDGATDVAAGGGFGPGAELVFGIQVDGPADLYLAAATAIGSASTDYALGQTALFAIQGNNGTALFRFVSDGTDAVVSSQELTLLATLTGTTAVAEGDFAFIA